MLTCLSGHTATTEFLIAKGANLEAKDGVRHSRGKCRPLVLAFCDEDGCLAWARMPSARPITSFSLEDRVLALLS
jgi:hypothetical protein